MPIHFAFGAARFDSVPAGAVVYSADGNYLGKTPLLVTELPPGTARYNLQGGGYDTATVAVTVTENETNMVSTNLVSLAYLGNLRAAQNDMATGNYQSAVHELEQALAAKRGDADATSLLTTAKGRAAVQAAKDLAGQGDYIGAGQKLQTALTILPDDAEAKSLAADYKTHEAGQLTQINEQRTRAAFDAEGRKSSISGLFETHEYRTPKKSPADFKTEFERLYAEEMPKAKLMNESSPEKDIYVLLFQQASQNPLVLARREMVFVVGKNKDDQTLVLFKTFEYQRKLTDNNADLLLNINSPDSWIPLHPSRIQMTPAFEEQIRVGYRMTMRKLMRAVNETYVYPGQ